METQILKVKKIHEDSITPTRGSLEAAGMDLYAYIPELEITIQPGTNAMIGTGVSFELPKGTFGAIFARSGMATKRGLRPSNCCGVCDSDYTGEYIVALYNDSLEPQTVMHGERIAQLVIMPYVAPILTEVADLSETARGDGGFGSSGN